MSVDKERRNVHEMNRAKVCAACGQKIFFKSISPSFFLINENIESQLKNFVCDQFSLTDPRYPKSICGTCRLTLSEHSKGISKRPLPIHREEFSKIVFRKNTRSSQSEDCGNCAICRTATFKGHKKTKKGRGFKRNFEKENIQIRQNTSTYCNYCYGKVGKGIPHPCTRSKKVRRTQEANVKKIIQKLPEKVQDRIVGGVLKRKILDDQDQKDTRHDITLNLTTMGKKMTVTVNPKHKKEAYFPAEFFHNYQTNTGASWQQMKILGNFIRCGAGRKSIPKKLLKETSDKGKLLQSLYKTGEFDFDIEKEKKESNAKERNETTGKAKRPVVYADATELLEAVISERHLIGNYFVKVMADSGQGFLKMSMSIIPEDHLKANSDEVTDEPAASKKTRYAEGGSTGKKAPVTSVKRLILLCVVPKVKESYDNMKLLFDLTQINKISFKFVSDFKLLLIVNGQQTATASYPCPFCFISLNDLRDKKDVDLGLKTYGDLDKDYKKFCFLQKNKKKAAFCHSTVNKPLFNENPDIKVSEKCMVPELHIMQGFVNHAFWHSLVNLVGREKALLWPEKLKIISKNYQGELFEGNHCRKLLQEADKLLDPRIYDVVGYLSLVPYVEAFKVMNQIVTDYFSNNLKNSKDSLEKKISQLKYHLRGIKITETLKIHVLVNHIVDSLDYLNGYGFGVWSEQAGESVHREFLKYWERYKINMLSDSSYANRLLCAVVEFSSRHI